MPSAHGLNGGPSRCFGEYQRWMACVSSKETSSRAQCVPGLDDYVECLHHKKEKARAILLNSELAALQAAGTIPKNAAHKKTLPGVLGLVEEN